MKRAFKSFIAFSLLIPILMSCNKEKQKVRASQPSETNEQVTAFKNINLVPMTDEKVLKDQAVLVKGKVIIEIGSSRNIKIPENAIVIDGAGAYLMPGLADMHMHTRPGWVTDYPVSPLDLYLANGVTTIRCFGPRGGSGKYVLRWRDEIDEGKRIGPTIYTCGPILYGPVKDPQKTVREQKAQGFDFVKLYSFVSKEEFHEAIDTAKKLGIYTAGHIPFAVGLDGVLSEGMNEIAHIEELDFEFLDFNRSKKLGRMEWFRYLMELAVQQWGESFGLDMEVLEKRYQSAVSDVIGKVQSAHVPVCTTLVVGQGIVQKLFEPETFLARPESTYLPPWYRDGFRQGKEKHQVMFKGHEKLAPFKYKMELVLLRKLKQAGVHLVLSTDAGTGSMGIVPGFSLHDELRILTENGFTPYEAIVAGTVNASKVVKAMLGVDDFGTIEVGKRADLLLVNENPLEDVTNIKDLRGVMAAGRWYEKAALQTMIKPGIPIIGAIKNVHEPDKSLKTTIEVVIGKGFTGNLPDDIDTITITGPKGDLPIGKDDFTYIPQLRDFFIRLPGSPEIGTYTFRVTSGTMRGSATDIQAVVRTIPLPDISTFSPAIGATLRPNTPTFSWGAVKGAIPVYYRLEIYRQHGGRVYSTHYGKGMLSHTVPDRVLKPGQVYRWRVRVADGDNWVTLNNRSHSQWLPFSVGQTHRQCEYTYQVPEKTDDGWKTSSLVDEGIDSKKIHALMRNILTRRFANVHGVLLVRNGKLVLEEYFNGYTFDFSGPGFRGERIAYGREKLHVTASVTKSVTSALVGIAIDRGLIRDVNESMAVFFPEYMNLIDEKKARITLEHLLTLTSGLEWNEVELWFKDPQFDLVQLFVVSDPIEYILSKRVIQEPGKHWYYSGGDVNLLGEIIRKSSGLRMDAFAARYLMTPLGITDYEWDHLNPDIIHASGNLKLRPRDMAKFGQLFLNGGTWKNQRIISETWTKKSIAPIVSIPKNSLLKLVAREYLSWAVNAGDRYGYLWWIKSYCTDSGCVDSYLADGWGGQRIIVFPSLDLVVVFTGGNYATPEPVHEIVCEYILPAVQ